MRDPSSLHTLLDFMTAMESLVAEEGLEPPTRGL